MNDPADPQIGDCLSDEVVAAVLDGRLTGKARADALEHLAVCPACAEILLGAGETLDHLTERAANARPRSFRPKWWLLAAVLSPIVVGLAFWRSTGVSDAPGVAGLVATLGSPGAYTRSAWTGSVHRGSPSSRVGDPNAAIGVGAILLDLHLALGASDVHTTSEVLYRLAAHCEGAGLLGQEVVALRGLASSGALPAAEVLDPIEVRLRARFSPELLDSGSLWEAARLAALAERREFFTRETADALRASLNRADLPAATAREMERAVASIASGKLPEASAFEAALNQFEPDHL